MIAPVDGDASARDASRAHHLLWLAFWTMLASVGVGLPWDVAWHTSRRFETVLSPPHLFVYATTALTVGLYLALLTAPRLRAAFGPGFAVPGVPFAVPGPLFLIGAGLGLLALGAIVDGIWHTAFGLDETRWSTPHALLGWGWGLAAFGFVSARLTLGSRRPLRWWTRAFLGLMLLAFSLGPLLGPFQHNHTLEKVQAVGAIPVLVDQAAYQHTMRIYQDWALVRSHPLFVSLGAAWVGLSLALLCAVDRRPVVALALVTFWTCLVLLRDRGAAHRLGLDLYVVGNWLPLPILPAALATALSRRLGSGSAVAAAVGGAVFGLVSQVVWPGLGPLAGLVLGAPCAALGAAAGSQLAAVLLRPTARGCVTLVVVVLLTPMATGAVDLYLRLHTP
jgi:hypothetical protein